MPPSQWKVPGQIVNEMAITVSKTARMLDIVTTIKLLGNFPLYIHPAQNHQETVMFANRLLQMKQLA